MGAAAHFESGDNSPAITVDKIGVIRSFDRRVAGMEIVRFNCKSASKDSHSFGDDFLPGANEHVDPFAPARE